MPKPRYLVSEPLRLDLLDERLWLGKVPIRLSHRGFAVLRCLMSHAGRLVTKDDLLTTAWANKLVSEASLTTTARELRRALGDQARSPKFIETVHGRGYRFRAPVKTVHQAPLPPEDGFAAEPAIPHTPASSKGVLVLCQKAEIEALLAALKQELKDHGDVVIFLSGPKNRRLEEFAEQNDGLLDIVSTHDVAN